MASQAAQEAADVPTASSRGRKATVVAVTVALLLAAAGAIGWWFLAGDSSLEKTAAKAEPVDAEMLVDIPPMTVNLRTPDGSFRVLRVHLMLVPGHRSKEQIESQLPLIIDAFQPFLRELRPDDIAGSAATFRLKEEMLIRCHAVLGEGAVRDVLIQDLVQQ